MNKEVKSKLDENTLIPVSFVIVILIAASAIGHTAFKANANEREIQGLKEESSSVQKELRKLNKAMGRVEGALGTKPSKEEEEE
jgi:hypothetical protein